MEGRFTRIAIGTMFFLFGIYFMTWWGLLGLVPMFMGVTGWCVIYQIFGISSYEAEQKKVSPPSAPPQP